MKPRVTAKALAQIAGVDVSTLFAYGECLRNSLEHETRNGVTTGEEDG